MRKIIIAVPMKKGLYFCICIVLLLLFLPILMIGIGNNKISKSTKNLNVDKTSQYTIKNDSIILKNKGEIPKIKVFLTAENRIEEMNIEDYVRGVVSGEMPISFEVEALKAQAVAARTYAVSKMFSLGGKACDLHASQGADICDTVHCQVYKSKEKRFKDWKASDAESNWNKLTDIIVATGGQVLTYNGELVRQPLYFSSSGGRTEDAVQVFTSNVPYLKSVESKGEDINSSKITISSKELASKINKAYPKAKVSVSKLKSQIIVLNRNSGGTVNDLKIGNETIKGRKFRELLGLRSANFSFEFSTNSVDIICLGYGHGVGMSQWGANAMASSGSSYSDILTHYYTGVNISKLEDVYK